MMKEKFCVFFNILKNRVQFMSDKKVQVLIFIQEVKYIKVDFYRLIFVNMGCFKKYKIVLK